MIRKFLFALLALGTIAPLSAAQSLSLPNGTTFVARSVVDDGDVAMYCKYLPGVAASPCASIAVDAATGDLTFTRGTCGAETAEDDFECPVAGALGGVIDTSNGSCNTLGKVVDIVNAGATEATCLASGCWRCVLHEGLRADSSNNTLLTIAATQATGPDGLALAFDTDVFLSITRSLSPANTAGFGYLTPSNSPVLAARPWSPFGAWLYSVTATSTYGAGTSLLYVYAVDRNFFSGSETVTTLWGGTAAGATTVAKSFGNCGVAATGCDPAWGPQGLLAPPGQQLLVRITNSNALASATLNIGGFFYPVGFVGLVR